MSGRHLLSPSRRGYGRGHENRRRLLAPYVSAGMVPCARCGELIRPGEPWDLGHHDLDRSRYTGPEHAGCNRSAAGRRRGLRTSRVL